MARSPMDGTDAPVAVEVSVGGRPIDDSDLIHRVETSAASDGRSRATVVMIAGDDAEACADQVSEAAWRPGNRIAIAAGYAGQPWPRIFDGLIKAHRLVLDDAVFHHELLCEALEEPLQAGGGEPVLSMTSGEDIIAASLETRGGDFGEIRGTLTIPGAPYLRCGDTVEVAGTGAPFSGLAPVSGIGHTIEVGAFRTEIRFGQF